MASSQKTAELSPTLNAYVRAKISKQEEAVSYASYVQAFALQATDDASHRGFVKKLLPRLAQYGYQPPGMVLQFRQLQIVSNNKDTRELLRLASFFSQLLLGDGSSGTPVVLPSSYWNNAAPKAVDTFDEESLVPCWQYAANDKAPLKLRLASLRALASASRASQTSRPDDLSVMMALLEGVRIALDQLQGAQQLLAFQTTRRKRAAISSAVERSSLQHGVFTAARAGLSQSSVSKIAAACITGATSPDRVVARHALAMAAVAAADRPHVCVRYLDKPLSVNIAMFKQTGSLCVGEGAALPFQFQASDAQPLNLQDPWSRVYLARACGAILYGSSTKADIDVYRQTLVILACTDPSDLVAVEAVRTMVGASTYKSATVRSVGGAGNRQHGRSAAADYDAAHAAAAARGWRVFCICAGDTSPGQSVLAALGLDAAGEAREGQVQDPSSRAAQVAMQADPALRRLVPKFAKSQQAPVIQKVTQRLLTMLSTHAGLCTACRTIAVLAEARATAYEQARSEDALGEQNVQVAMDVLQERLLAIVNETLPPSERVLALEALMWMQLPDHPILLPPSTIMQLMLRCGLTIPADMRTMVADPWPSDTLSAFYQVLQRRLALSPSLASYIMECGNVAAAVCPSRVNTEQLQLLWDVALRHASLPVKHAAFHGSMQLLLMQASPVTLPSSHPIAQIKAMAAEEEAGLHMLNRLAALWLGENTADYAWCAKGELSGQQQQAGHSTHEQLAIESVAQQPIVIAVLTKLQQAMLTGPQEVKVAAVQAIAKIGVRCGEPYRIQCYSILASVREDEGSTHAAPLGLAGVVAPVLQLMDAIYATNTVLAKLCVKAAAQNAPCPPDLLEAAQARHDLLHDLVSRQVGFVQKEMFRIGPSLSKLGDDDDTDQEEEGGGSAKDSSDDDSSDVSTPSDASSSSQPSSPSALAPAPGALLDILSQFQGGKESNEKADSSDEDDGDTTADTSNWYQQPYAADGDVGDEGEDTAYPATVLYDFISNYDEEVTVSKGDKVSVTYELGGWVNVITPSGQQGLVPAEYVQLDGQAEPLQQQDESGWPFAQPGGSGPGANGAGSNWPGGNGAGEEPADTSNPYAYPWEDPARRTVDSDDTEQQQEDDSAAPVYDWFAKAPTNRESEQGGIADWYQQDSSEQAAASWPFQDAGGLGDRASGPVYSEDGDRWGDTAAASSAFDDQPSYPPVPASPARPSPWDPSPSVWDPAPAEQPYNFASTAGDTGLASPASVKSTSSFHRPRRSVDELLRSASSISSQATGASLSRSITTGATTGAAAVTAQVMYTFQAEAEGELTVNPGDQLVVMGEVEGWLQVVRESDKAIGLVPADYVQMMQ